MLTDAIVLGSSRLPWGITIDRARGTAGLELLPDNPHTARADRERQARVAVQEVLGAATLACELRGPAPRKPVLEVRYSVATDAAYATLEAALVAAYGEPERSSWEQARGSSGSILARALFRAPGFELNLSAYGAPRVESPPATPAAGFLAIVWRDWEAAARPYLSAIADVEAELTRGYDGTTAARARLGDPQPALCDGDRAKRAVMLDDVFDTPAPLALALAEDEVTLWRASPETPWLLSTRTDTLRMRPDGGLSLVSRPGTLAFEVDALSLSASSESEALRVFADEVARATGRELETIDMRLWR